MCGFSCATKAHEAWNRHIELSPDQEHALKRPNLADAMDDGDRYVVPQFSNVKEFASYMRRERAVRIHQQQQEQQQQLRTPPSSDRANDRVERRSRDSDSSNGSGTAPRSVEAAPRSSMDASVPFGASSVLQAALSREVGWRVAGHRTLSDDARKLRRERANAVTPRRHPTVTHPARQQQHTSVSKMKALEQLPLYHIKLDMGSSTTPGSQPSTPLLM